MSSKVRCTACRRPSRTSTAISRTSAGRSERSAGCSTTAPSGCLDRAQGRPRPVGPGNGRAHPSAPARRPALREGVPRGLRPQGAPRAGGAHRAGRSGPSGAAAGRSRPPRRRIALGADHPAPRHPDGSPAVRPAVTGGGPGRVVPLGRSAPASPPLEVPPSAPGRPTRSTIPSSTTAAGPPGYLPRRAWSAASIASCSIGSRRPKASWKRPWRPSAPPCSCTETSTRTTSSVHGAPPAPGRGPDHRLRVQRRWRSAGGPPVAGGRRATTRRPGGLPRRVPIRHPLEAVRGRPHPLPPARPGPRHRHLAPPRRSDPRPAPPPPRRAAAGRQRPAPADGARHRSDRSGRPA